MDAFERVAKLMYNYFFVLLVLSIASQPAKIHCGLIFWKIELISFISTYC